MNLSCKIYESFKKTELFSLAEVYAEYPQNAKETIRARIYEQLDIKFKRLAIGIYQTIDGEESCGFMYYSKVTWKKGNFVSNTGRKSKNSQDVMIFSNGKARNLRIDVKRTAKTGRTEYMSGTNGMLPTMFDVQPVPKNKKIHQSEMPVGLIEQILEFVTTEGEVVLDTFAGSGVVGEACLNKKRNCILVELCHENIEKIKQRFENNLMFRAVEFQTAR